MSEKAEKPPKKRGVRRLTAILLFLGLISGLSGAAVLYLNRKPVYQSSAKFLVHYVLKRGEIDDYELRKAVTGQEGKGIIRAEIDILTSLDVASETVEKIGPERILGPPESEEEADEEESPLTTSEELAAASLLKNLKVGSTGGSGVIRVAYWHENPIIAAEVLQELMKNYFERHLEIHRSIMSLDMVSRQADLRRTRLRATEEQLAKKKKEAGIMSLSDAIRQLERQRSLMETKVLDVNADLVSQQARLKAMEAELGSRDLVKERANLAALEARTLLFEEQAKKVELRFDQLSAIAPEIEALERRKEMEVENFRHSDLQLKKARIDQALDPDSLPNINFIQRPSIAVKTYRTTWITMILAGTGILCGLALAIRPNR